VTEERPDQGFLTTAGETIGFRSDLPAVAHVLREAASASLGLPRKPSIRVVVEDGRHSFPTKGWRSLARDAWELDGEVVVRDVCTAGFDLWLRIENAIPTFTYRRRPPLRTRALASADRSRALLLTRSALISYPAMWWAATKGVAPLHAGGVDSNGNRPLIVGPSGAGKTTVAIRTAAAGGKVVSDNVVVGDGNRVWGVVEPMRSEGGTGRAMPHGRRESPLPNRVDSLAPDRIVILRQGPETRVRATSAEHAAKWLVASTYAAGELRRFWPFAATLALGTGIGPSHPPVAAIAGAFARSLPCLEVELASALDADLGAVLERWEQPAWTLSSSQV
jgi:hypothetical protein